MYDAYYLFFSALNIYGIQMDPNKIHATLEPTSRQYYLTDTHQRTVDQQCVDTVRNKRDKCRYAIIAGILFMIISASFMYRFTESILGRLMTVAIDGVPTNVGLLLHSIVFIIALYVIMILDI